MSMHIATNEQILINMLIEDPEYIYRFDQNYFISQIARDIFEASKKCFLENLELTSDNIVIFGNKSNGAITKNFIDDLKRKDFDISQFDKHYKLLRIEYAKKQISEKLLREVLIESERKGELNIEKLESLKEEINKNIEVIQGKESLLLNLDTMFERYKLSLLERKNGIGKYPTGDSYLDHYLTLGFAPGYMTSIFADSGVGKSIFALNLINRQINKGIPCLYISPENDLNITMDRLAAMRLNINYDEFYFKEEQSEADIDIINQIEEEKERLKNIKNFYFVDESELSLADIELLGKEAKRKMGVDYLVVTIDLLSMIKEFAVNIDAQAIEENMNALHRIAKRGKYHFINILQANGDAVSGFKPKKIEECSKFRFTNIGNMKNARAWGERSRTVLGLFRPKLLAENTFGKENPEVEIMDDIAYIQILKQNQGPLGILKYYFNAPKFQMYRYVEKQT